MKNVLLFIVLGLFVVSCSELDGPMYHTEESEEDWKCPGDNFTSYRETCFDNCEEDCYECEWVETNWGGWTCE